MSTSRDSMARRGRIAMILLAALVTWRCGRSPAGLGCEYDAALSATHCGCSIGVPVDLAAYPGAVELWPFGVHATSGHTEGHPGLDLITLRTTVPVMSPVDGTVSSVDNSQDNSGTMATEYGNNPSVRFTTITADCGLRVKLVPVLLDAGITAGRRVRLGERLGTLAPLVPAFGSRFATHFEIDAKPSPAERGLAAVCPPELVSAADRSALGAALGISKYPEKVARTVNIACEAGPPLTISYPAEDQLCNARLDATARSRLAACLPSKADRIW